MAPHYCWRSRVPRLAAGVTLLSLLLPVGLLADEQPSLKLQMDVEFGRLGPAPVDEDPTTLLPVLLGITNIAHRIQVAERETETWKTANQALVSHLEAREQHLNDLQAFVERQDGAIDVLEQQAASLERMAQLPGVGVPASVGVANPATGAGSAELFGVPLGSPYLSGGLLAVIAVLLAWSLGLRSRLSREPRAAASPALRSPLPEAPLAAAAARTAQTAPVSDLEKPLPAPEADDEWSREHESKESLTAAAESTLTSEEPPDFPPELLGDETPPPAEERPPVLNFAGSDDDAAVKPADVASVAAAEAKTGRPKTETDAVALTEIDTLIAFENYDEAAELLNRLLDDSPDNPEYRLRLLHILSAAGEAEATKEQEEILEAMMDGPLSETLARVRRIGQNLLPGHPLFHRQDDASAGVDEAEAAVPAVFDVTAGASEEPEEDTLRETAPETSTETQPLDEVEMLAEEENLEDFIKSTFDSVGTQDGESSLDFALDFGEEASSASELSVVETVVETTDEQEKEPPLELELYLDDDNEPEAPKPESTLTLVADDGDQLEELALDNPPEELEDDYAATVYSLRERSGPAAK